MNTEQLVYSLIKEAIEIGMKDVDLEKSKGGYQNMLGQGIPNIVMKPGRSLFYIVQSNGDEIPNSRIKEIGLKLHQFGGLQLMQQAYYDIIKPFGGHGPNLKWVWENVGNWHP
ncbi:hypothetical protein [Cyclobacterium jeungdonense]|uniref:Uncharacterized protein n=1 Tax=Cyclobacterium jeungdonense TaxID=708087 RepID=A0ABT8C381_9BACT|nr:hypothetical protein [Cyclobacterium jeungdonense]MDN3687233.1 hypothetical protein [Cyclobacterium jeungdonense]